MPADLRLNYDVATRRGIVSFDDRHIYLPGWFDNYEEALKAALVYAARYRGRSRKPAAR